ncbi:Fc.00g110970.m01.CDS01 [Cosmosporella sp. VM-42]
MQSIFGLENRLILDEGGTEFSVTETIEKFCGIGGVTLETTQAGTGVSKLGCVDIVDSKIAVVHHFAPYEALCSVLENLDLAASILKYVGGCCDSFTFLTAQRNGGVAELHRIDLQLIRDLLQYFRAAVPKEDMLAMLPPPPGLLQLMQFMTIPEENGFVNSRSFHTLITQFLSLAFLSYSQAHGGPICPSLLDAPIERVVLKGIGVPCILASLVELTCFGDMLQQPVWAFQYLDIVSLSDAIGLPMAGEKLDLFARSEDLLDIWGLGEFLACAEDPDYIYAIHVGGGTIVPSVHEDSGSNILHWSRDPRICQLPTTRFLRGSKALIRKSVSINSHCKTEPEKQLRMAFGLLGELGTSPSYS